MSLALILSCATLLLPCTLALLGSRWPAWHKGLLVVGTTGLYFWGDDVVHKRSGWPTADALLNEGMKKARQGISQMGNAVPTAGKPAKSTFLIGGTMTLELTEWQ